MSEFEADRLAHQALIEEFNQLESNHNLSTLSVETSNESGYFTSSSELDKNRFVLSFRWNLFWWTVLDLAYLLCGSFSAPKKPIVRSLTRLDKPNIDLNLDTGLVVKLNRKVKELTELNAKLEKEVDRYESEISVNKTNLALFSKVVLCQIT